MPAARIYLQYAALDELESSLALATREWLHPGERQELARLSHPRRRRQWLWGRWLGKQLVRQALPGVAADSRSIWIRSRNSSGRGIRPEVLLDNRRQPWSMSLAHSDRAAVVCLGVSPEASLGVDLVELQPLEAGFQRVWFTKSEREFLASQPVGSLRAVGAFSGPPTGSDQLGGSSVCGCGEEATDLSGPHAAVTVWALKEAIYKAVHRGEGFAPRRIEVRLRDTGNYAGKYRGVSLDDVCRLRTWEQDGHVMALAESYERAEMKGH